MFLFFIFTLCAVTVSLFLCNALGLLDDVLCWIGRCRYRSIPHTSGHQSRVPANPTKGKTFVYMVHSRGCIHCKRAIPEFKKLRQWCRNRDALRGKVQAVLITPNRLGTDVPEIQSPSDFLSNGVPLYVVVQRGSRSSRRDAHPVIYRGARTAESILKFALSHGRD